MADDCLFCKMATGDVPVEKVYDNAKVFAIRDINPRAPVHILVIPRRHVPMVSDLQRDDAELLGEMFVAANAIARQEGLDASGYRLAFNAGNDAGQSVYHIHMHVLGGRRLGPEA
jgi:histidine triad (HIT) family protein